MLSQYKYFGSSEESREPQHFARETCRGHPREHRGGHPPLETLIGISASTTRACLRRPPRDGGERQPRPRNSPRSVSFENPAPNTDDSSHLSHPLHSPPSPLTRRAKVRNGMRQVCHPHKVNQAVDAVMNADEERLRIARLKYCTAYETNPVENLPVLRARQDTRVRVHRRVHPPHRGHTRGGDTRRRRAVGHRTVGL